MTSNEPAPSREIPARIAVPARRGRGALGTVEAARENTGRRGLAATAGTGEQIGVIDPVLAQGSHEGLGHMFLTDDILEGLRAIAAVQGGSHV